MSNKKQAGVGSPRGKESRAQSTAKRPNRTPVGGYRNILGVTDLDTKAYHYRWVHDQGEAGSRIVTFKDAGYDLVTSEEAGNIGDNKVFKSEDVGSIVRISAGSTGKSEGYLYLMRIRREWYEEDQEAKQLDILDAEKQMVAEVSSKDDGRYGKFKLS